MAAGAWCVEAGEAELEGPETGESEAGELAAEGSEMGELETADSTAGESEAEGSAKEALI